MIHLNRAFAKRKFDIFKFFISQRRLIAKHDIMNKYRSANQLSYSVVLEKKLYEYCYIMLENAIPISMRDFSYVIENETQEIRFLFYNNIYKHQPW